MRKIFLLYAFSILVVSALTFGLTQWVAPEDLPYVWREGSVIEHATAYLFGIAALVGFYNARAMRVRGWLYGGLLMMFALMREMDLHKEVTSDSVFKSRFYSGDFPLEEKLFGAVIVFTLLFLIFFFIKQVPRWVKLLRAKDPVSWVIFLALGTGAVAKGLDSITRLYPPIAPFYEAHRPPFVLMEELLELLLSMIFCGVFVYGARCVRKAKPLFISSR